ncbi:recombinase family protein [Chitinophaga sancti]|uniref:Resolvase, N terminal domain n=1 Tax=Chitinophaga sancti TaxID=1004 RepID=A0A1K1LQ80_9BACT|nr:Resolvase, N terminal domain [Chitinophaga sancti]
MNAIGYIRLSRKDQSKYSFDGQESAIKAYCLKYDLQLLSIFRDNGECSDTFNRANFKALELFLCRDKGIVKYLIVMNHDRFSRDVSKALSKISELKRRHGVTVLSTEEPIDLNTSDPQVFISGTLKYAMANTSSN